ncbi:MAG: hypothetical protein JRI67_09815, partial [Deltaproteobacteria bacterium]|nr:hypothetical protein [Deltaproteobacteria bacterium]
MRSIVFLSILACLAGGLFGCGPKHAQEVIEKPGIEFVWPAPPAPPRIKWVGEFKDWNATVVKKGLWNRLKEVLIGQEPRFIIKPYGIYVDEQDRLFIVDVGARLIHFMDLKSRQYSVIPKEGS